MQAVIMAGGKGTRLLSLTNNELPKPMVSVAGKPILEHQINILKKNNITDLVIVTGYLGEKIIQYFGSGEAFGVSIHYIQEQQPLGTAGSLYYMKPLISEDFLLVFGDIIFDIDIARMVGFHQSKKAKATLFVHPNSHPYDSDLLVLDENQCVIGFDSKTNVRDYFYDNCVNGGLYVLSPEIIEMVETPIKFDLEKDILFPLILKKCVYGYYSSEYVRDVGTPERLFKAQTDIEMGNVEARNFSIPQKCIFMDRDGTINKFKGLLYKAEDLELEDGAVEAIKLLNQSQYLCVVITNQPVAARGLCTIEDINNIHKKLETMLGNAGVYLNGIAFCPHHPDKGYPEENPALKMECNCRKPKTGMVDNYIKKYNIDRAQSWFVGDTTSDVQTGKNAGLKTILLKSGEGGNDKKYTVEPDELCSDVLEAVKKILEVNL